MWLRFTRKIHKFNEWTKKKNPWESEIVRNVGGGGGGTQQRKVVEGRNTGLGLDFRRWYSSSTEKVQRHVRLGLSDEDFVYRRQLLERLTTESSYQDSREKLVEAWTLDPDTYTSHEFYQLEQKQIFQHSWVCVGLVDKLRYPGDTIRAKLGKSPIFVTRDKRGNLNGFHNVCRHRGSLLVLEDGRYPVISCPYHRWGYSLDGRLLATPMWDMNTEDKKKSKRKGRRAKKLGTEGGEISSWENEDQDVDELTRSGIQKIEELAASPPQCDQLKEIQEAMGPVTTKGFDKKDYPLFDVRVETWGPYVFATMCEDVPDIRTCLGDMTNDLKRYPLDELVVARSKSFAPNANWKLLMENFMEYYHLPAVHPELCLVSGVDEHDRRQGKGMNTGFITYPLTRGGTPIDPGILPPMPGLDKEEQKTAWFHALFPNTFYFLMPDHIFVVVLSPDGPNRTVEHSALLVHPSVRDQGIPDLEKKLDNMMAFYDKTNIEDIVACERVQEGVESVAYEGGRFSFKFEETIHRFQNMCIDHMIGEPRIPAGDEDSIGDTWDTKKRAPLNPIRKAASSV